MIDNNETKIDEDVVLSKYEGAPLPENEIERVHIHNGTVTEWYRIENGVPVERLDKEVN